MDVTILLLQFEVSICDGRFTFAAEQTEVFPQTPTPLHRKRSRSKTMQEPVSSVMVDVKSNCPSRIDKAPGERSLTTKETFGNQSHESDTTKYSTQITSSKIPLLPFSHSIHSSNIDSVLSNKRRFGIPFRIGSNSVQYSPLPSTRQLHGRHLNKSIESPLAPMANSTIIAPTAIWNSVCPKREILESPIAHKSFSSPYFSSSIVTARRTYDPCDTSALRSPSQWQSHHDMSRDSIGNLKWNDIDLKPSMIGLTSKSYVTSKHKEQLNLLNSVSATSIIAARVNLQHSPVVISNDGSESRRSPKMVSFGNRNSLINGKTSMCTRGTLSGVSPIRLTRPMYRGSIQAQRVSSFADDRNSMSLIRARYCEGLESIASSNNYSSLEWTSYNSPQGMTRA